jgi:hypothetical protein
LYYNISKHKAKKIINLKNGGKMKDETLQGIAYGLAILGIILIIAIIL